MSEFPLHAWRYHARIDASGTDRQNLPDCLEEEDLACFRFQDRETCYEQIRAGEWTISGAFAEPYVAFPQGLSIVSLYLFQIVKGVEISERYASRDKVDDVRAWKVVARRGEWVKVPLQVGRDEDGAFHVNAEDEDLEVVRARWEDYPLWFQDGMRSKHPVLRDL